VATIFGIDYIYMFVSLSNSNGLFINVLTRFSMQYGKLSELSVV